MKKPTKADQVSAAGAIAGGESIDQIREILFGSMRREVMSHLEAIEKQLEKEKAERTKQLENTKKSFDQRLEKLSDNLTGKLDQLKTELNNSQKENRTNLADASKNLNASISNTYEELKSSLSDHAEEISASLDATRSEFERALNNLDSEKTGRDSLGDYLLEIGMRLKGDATLNAISSSVVETRDTKVE